MQHSERPLWIFYKRLAESANTPIIKTPYYQSLSVKDYGYPSAIFLPTIEEPYAEKIIIDIRQKIPNGFPPVIITSPLQTSEATLDALEKYCEYKTHWAAMSMDLDDLEQLTDNEQITVKQTTSLHEISTWCRIVEEGLMGGRKMNEHHFYTMSTYSDVYFYTAYYKNIPVATALTVITKEDVGVYLIATLDQFRRKGIGNFITQTALVEAKSKGATKAHLQATTLGEGVYKKIGFQKLMNVAVFKV